jgi:uncharacterized protein YndB with AHSA1/START domain
MEIRTRPTGEMAHDERVEVAIADRSMTLTRWFDAPRERVWRAWTDPAELAQWWGPHGYTNPIVEADARPEGTYRIVMRSPEGIDYPTTGRFLEVDGPNRLVFTDEASDMPPDWQAVLDEYTPSSPDGTELRIVNTVTFEDRDGGTLMTIISAFVSDEDRDAVIRMGAVSGWSESFEKLDRLIAAA